MVVLDVALEVSGQVVDARGEDRNLDFRRAGIAGLGGIFRNERGLALSRNRHRVILSKRGFRIGLAGMSSSKVGCQGI